MGDRTVIRLVLAAGISTMVSLLGTKALIVVAQPRHRIGQPIHEDVPEGHTVKAGTPTMGGVAIVAGAIAGYLVSDITTASSHGPVSPAWRPSSGPVLVGFLDDWIKVSQERNLGLNKRAKMVGLLAVAVGVRACSWSARPTCTPRSASRGGTTSAGPSAGSAGSIWAVLLISARPTPST